MSVWKKNGRQHAQKSLGLVYQELMSTTNIVQQCVDQVPEAVYTSPNTEHKMDFRIEKRPFGNEHEFGLSSSPYKVCGHHKDSCCYLFVYFTSRDLW